MRIVQQYVGRAEFHIEMESDGHSLLVAVECLIGSYPHAVHALVDTAAQWCVLPPKLAVVLQESERLMDVLLHTRHGLFSGGLYGIPLIFPATEGEICRLEATWFVSEEWPGPAVIGWKGGLERLRFALDPFSQQFYFASEPDASDLPEPTGRRRRR